MDCKDNADSISSSFVENVDLLTEEVLKNICENIRNDSRNEAFETARLVNRTLAFFLQDLLSCLQPTRVLEFISTYLKTVSYSAVLHRIFSVSSVGVFFSGAPFTERMS